MTAIAKRYEIGGVIRTAEVARHKMMNVRLTASASSTTSNAPMIVAVEHNCANLLPSEFLSNGNIWNSQGLAASRTSDHEP
jgi:hypothetical protein